MTMKTVELDEAQATLGELIAGLTPNDDILIVQNQKPVARIVPPNLRLTAWASPRAQDQKPVARVAPPKRGTPKFGSCKGMLTIISDDHEHLKDFAEYMD